MTELWSVISLPLPDSWNKIYQNLQIEPFRNKIEIQRIEEKTQKWYFLIKFQIDTFDINAITKTKKNNNNNKFFISYVKCSVHHDSFDRVIRDWPGTNKKLIRFDTKKKTIFLILTKFLLFYWTNKTTFVSKLFSSFYVSYFIGKLTKSNQKEKKWINEIGTILWHKKFKCHYDLLL